MGSGIKGVYDMITLLYKTALHEGRVKEIIAVNRRVSCSKVADHYK